MKVDSIKTSFISTKNTGYAAATSLGVAIASGISKNKTFRKSHKPAAYLAAIFTALHIGLIESYKHKHRKM